MCVVRQVVWIALSGRLDSSVRPLPDCALYIHLIDTPTCHQYSLSQRVLTEARKTINTLTFCHLFVSPKALTRIEAECKFKR